MLLSNTILAILISKAVEMEITLPKGTFETGAGRVIPRWRNLGQPNTNKSVRSCEKISAAMS